MLPLSSKTSTLLSALLLFSHSSSVYGWSTWDNFFSSTWSKAYGLVDSSSSSSSSSGSSGSSTSSSDSSRSSSASATKTSSAPASTASAVHNQTVGVSNFTISPPYFFLYSTDTGALPDPSTLDPLTNIFAFTFWMDSGTVLGASTWAAMSSADQISTKEKYNNAGIKLLVSAYGSSETPVTSNVDPTTSATNLAAWVKANNLDGVDIDFEDFAAMDAGTAVPWLKTFQTELRSQLGDSYIISHAPIAPWFTSNTSFYQGGYLEVEKEVGSGINFYNVQFYNQGTYYEDCTELVSESQWWSGTSIGEIVSSGVSANKLILGKPGTTAEASGGFTDPSTLGGCVSTLKGNKWDGGLMVWAYSAAPNNWFTEIWGSTSNSASS